MDEHLDTDLRGLLLVFWRRRMAIVLTFAAGVALAGLCLALITPQYAGRALILVNTNAREIIPKDIGGTAGAGRYDASLILNQVEILRSRTLARGVIERLGLMRDPEFNRTGGNSERAQADTVSQFISRLGIRPVPGSYAIQLEFLSRSPAKAAQAANTIADVYIEQSMEQDFAMSQKLAAWMDKRLNELRAELQARESAVQDYRREHNIVGSSTPLAEGEVESLNKQLVAAKGAQAEAEAKLQQISGLLQSPQQMSGAGAVLQSEVIQKLKLEQARLEANLSERSTRYGPKHPEILKLTSEIEETRAAIQGEINTVAAAAENELELADAKVAALEAALAQSGGQKLQDDERMIGLRALEMEAESIRQILDNLLKTYKRGGGQEELQQPGAKIISYAVVPRAPSYPNTNLVLSLSAIAALFAAIILALLLEKLDNTFRSGGQIEGALRLPCFGLIPNVGKIRPPLLGRYGLIRPASQLAESIRTLRMVLNLRAARERPKIVTITSSFPGEGKTTLSLWLARAAASSGERAIVVDADLRRPHIHRAAGQRGEAALADYLSGEKEIDRLIHRDSESAAHIIFGRPAPDALDLLGTQRMKELTLYLRKRYDLVIIDSPACLAVPDARLLATLSDCVLYAVRWDKTPREAVAGGVKQFAEIGVDALALVLTAVDMKRHAAYGYGDTAAYYTYAKREAA